MPSSKDPEAASALLQVRKKQATIARLSAMHDRGALTPSFTGLRLDAAASTADAKLEHANYLGMCERLEAGDNREPTVVPSA